MRDELHNFLNEGGAPPSAHQKLDDVFDEIERLRAALREVLSDYEAYEPGEVKPLHDPDILKRAKEALGD